MNSFHKKILAEYSEILQFVKNNTLNIEDDVYGRLKVTLNFLEEKEYIRDLDIDNAHLYHVDDSFLYFEEQFLAEIGEDVPQIILLINMLPKISLGFKSNFLRSCSIYTSGEFVEWKTRLQYELSKLMQNQFIIDISTLLDSFDGWSDERKFTELSAKLKILKDNLNDFLIVEKQVEENLDLDRKKVFIVHGHNTSVRNDVELFLRRLDIDPVILANEANRGRTVIEKFEDHSDVSFAIVLYTACDLGKAKEASELQERARQNVVFEHGYFCAKLGRENVVALHEEGVEIPSDLSGILYVSLENDWKAELKKEMSEAGIEADWTKG